MAACRAEEPPTRQWRFHGRKKGGNLVPVTAQGQTRRYDLLSGQPATLTDEQLFLVGPVPREQLAAIPLPPPKNSKD